MCADKPSGSYEDINKATTNIPSQYATPTARAPIAAEEEQKVDAYTGPELSKQVDIYEEIEGPPSKYLDLKEEKGNTNNPQTAIYSVKLVLTSVFIFSMIAFVSMFIALFLQMRILHEMNRALQNSFEKLNNEKIEITEQTNLSFLHNLVLSTDSKIKQFNISFVNLRESVNDFISAQQNINGLVLTRFSTIQDFFYFSSCSDTDRLNSSYTSGNYIVTSSTGVLRSVYCDVNRTFGGDSTGWMRVAELDVNNCPPGLRHGITNSVSTCVVIEDNAGCTEITYPVYNIQYTKITGQIRGYQVGSSDGFISLTPSIPRPTNFTDINNNYLDGISISTNGQHVWSFAAGCNCPHTRNKPTIIGEDYICGGVASSSYAGILWASQQCGRNSNWFYKVLPATITDIKVRICRNQFRADEDLAITTLQLYTQ